VRNICQKTRNVLPKNSANFPYRPASLPTEIEPVNKTNVLRFSFKEGLFRFNYLRGMPGCDCEVSPIEGLESSFSKNSFQEGKTMKFDLNSRAAGSTKRSDLRPASRSLTLAQKGLMTLGIAAATFMLAAPAQAIILPARNGAPPICTGPVPCPVAVPVGVSQTPTPVGPIPFDIVGAIQAFTVLVPGNLYSGGNITVNGVNVLIPTNLVITMPASYQTVGQLFVNSPVANQSALALADIPAPIAAYEVTISGNVVGGVYIAGLVSIAQQSLNIGAGIIKSINNTTGALCVGATAGVCNPLTDARVIINDPSGRYGLANPGPDTRFAVDSDNPTIHARSGYPMCVPRVGLPAIDARCPDTNRPILLGIRATTFAMSAVPVTAGAPFASTVIAAGGPLTNPNEQAPLVVGDSINYSGVLARDGTGVYVAAYSIEANVGIYTAPGAPNYIFMDAPLLGTGPFGCPPNAECQARLRTTVQMTDPSGNVRPIIYAVDETLAGARTLRALSSLTVNTAQIGRWVFNTDKDTNTFGGAAGPGAPREHAVLASPGNGATGVGFFPLATGTPLAGNRVTLDPTAVPPVVAAANTANGLLAGQYVSPTGEFIFPEAIIGGAPLTPYNFRCLRFLVNGWGQGGDPTGLRNIGRLTPFPEVITPLTASCNL
jgi:hypothetical protein